MPIAIKISSGGLSERMIQDSMPIFGGSGAYTGALVNGSTLVGFAPAAGQAWYCDTLCVSCSVAAHVQLSISVSALLPAAQVPPMHRVLLQPGVPLTLTINRWVTEGSGIGVVALAGAGDATTVTTLSVQGYAMSSDVRFDAPRTMVVVTDSIGSGTGVTYGPELYTWMLRDYLWGLGGKYKIVHKGRGGWSSTHAEIARMRSMMTPSKADFILYNLGMNDSAVNPYASVNLPAFIAHKKLLYPDARMLVCGPSPRQDSAETTVLAPLRAAGQAVVAAAADPKIRFVDLGVAFSNVGDTNYMTTDGTTAGTRVHPNSVGHAAMFARARDAFPDWAAWIGV